MKHDSKKWKSHAISLPTAQESEPLWMFSTFSGYRSVLADGLTQLTLWTGRLSPTKFHVRHLALWRPISFKRQHFTADRCVKALWHLGLNQTTSNMDIQETCFNPPPPPKKKHTEKHPLKKKTSTTIKASHHKTTLVFFSKGALGFFNPSSLAGECGRHACFAGFAQVPRFSRVLFSLGLWL